MYLEVFLSEICKFIFVHNLKHSVDITRLNYQINWFVFFLPSWNSINVFFRDEIYLNLKNDRQKLWRKNVF